MPFSAAMVGIGGGRIFTLAKLDVEDLAALYVVETQIALQFPTLAPSRTGDVIQLTLGGVIFVAALASNYCIDADGLNDEAIFDLTLEAGCFIRGRGGVGGKGGFGSHFSSTDGSPGLIGGTAIRLGCPTNILGIGTIERGYGGGGGGGGDYNPGPMVGAGGGGGGGGAPLGLGSVGGDGEADAPPEEGADGVTGATGSIASILLGGAGGTGVILSSDGGDGGSEGIPSQNGDPGGIGTSGGLGGDDGDSIDSQGFTPILGPSIITIGPII